MNKMKWYGVFKEKSCLVFY